MLKKLEISALRGATRAFCLDFEKDKKITIVYGENGTGKSTICDAIELLACSKLGSLEGKGLGRTEGFWHSTGAKPGDMAVTLTGTQGQWSAKIVRGKIVVTPDQGRPHAAVLRRSQILGLIAQQPRTRFDAIRPFLDIDLVEQSEAALKQLIDQETVNERTARARVEENRMAIESFWLEAGRLGGEALGWAREVSLGMVAQRPVPFRRPDSLEPRAGDSVRTQCAPHRRAAQLVGGTPVQPPAGVRECRRDPGGPARLSHAAVRVLRAAT